MSSTVRRSRRLACLVACLGAALLPARTAATSPGSHHSPSYRMIFVATYTAQPDQNLPAAAAGTIGRHEIIERMTVRDATHYRVDIQTVTPGIDGGTLTVSVAGQKMTAYDGRAGLAAWNTVMGPIPQPSDMEIGTGLSPMAPAPEPGQSFQQYLATVRGSGSVLHPTVRIVGHTHLLGHPVAILDYGPLIGTGRPVCPRPSRRVPHPVCHSTTGSGRARLWVATDRTALLRYTEGHFTGLPGGMMRQHYLYRVSSLQFGSVSLAATQYRPPTFARKSTWMQTAVIGSGDSGWFAGWPERWRTGVLYRAPPPADSRGHRYVEDGVFIRRDTLEPIPSAIGVLYYRPGAPPFPGAKPAQYRGSGPYVYLQERIQVHGLPTALRRGRHLQRGHCSVWTGQYTKGAPWVALAQHRLAFLATSDSLTQNDLIRYAFTTLCG